MYVKFVVVSVASDRITRFSATKHENPNDRLVSSIRDVSILQILYRFIFIAMVVPVIPIERVRKRRRREKKKKKGRQARKRNKTTYRVPCRSCHSHSCRSVYTGTRVHLIVRGPRRGYVASSRHDEVLSGVMDMSPLSSGISGGIPGHSQYALLFTGQ